MYGGFTFFLDFKSRVVESYPEIFESTEGSGHTTRLEGFNKKWGWFQSVYGLCNGDIIAIPEITKLKLHRCLMHLCYQKDKADVEKELIKKSMKR